MNATKGATQRNPRRRNTTAMALVAIMMCLMLLLAVALIGFSKMAAGTSSGDLGTTSNNVIQLSKARINGVQADNLADVGLRAAVQWISGLASPPTNAIYFTPLEVTPTEFYADTNRWDASKWTCVNFPDSADSTKGQFRVRFYPHSDNSVALQRAYLIESIGIYNGVQRVVRADVKQRNFAQYAYFTDNVGTGFFVAGRTAFNGPVHMNNSNHADINVLWNNTLPTSQSRIFTWSGDAAFTMWQGDTKTSGPHANDNTMKWHKNSYLDNTAPSTAADWDTISPDGQKNLPKPVVDKIDLPTSSTEQKSAALGSVTEPTTSNRVYIPSGGTAVYGAASGSSFPAPEGGIYIRGTVNEMVLSATGTNNKDQKIVIYQNNRTQRTTITIGANGTTTMAYATRSGTTFGADTVKTFSGPVNGVIYSYDDIGNTSAITGTNPDGRTGGISGTLARGDVDASGVPTRLNKLNIVTRETKGIVINGDIQMDGVSKTATQANADSGILGLVGQTIYVSQSTSDPQAKTNRVNPITDLTVHATLMAYNKTGSIGANDTGTIVIDAYDTRPKGSFYMIGGYIASIGTPFGIADAASGIMNYGFQRILNYDKRVANQPPPYFPGTGQNYEIVSYQRVNQTLQP